MDRYVSRLSFFISRYQVYTWVSLIKIVEIGITFYIQNFAWVDTYLDCGCITSDDHPIFSVSGRRGVK